MIVMFFLTTAIHQKKPWISFFSGNGKLPMVNNVTKLVAALNKRDDTKL
jgi:hypothetical protein